MTRLVAALLAAEQGNGAGGGVKKGAAAKDDGGWVDEQLAGELDGEWVEVVEGLRLEGRLERAFATLNDENQPRACYALRGQKTWPTKDGAKTEEGVWLFGERAAFKDAIREQRLGSSVRMTFLSKEPIVRNGKKTTMDMWKLKFQSKRDGTGETVEKALLAYYRRKLAHLVLRPNMVNPNAEEFVPF